MREHFNKLTPAQAERLALLSEELGEVQQAIWRVTTKKFVSPYGYTQTFKYYDRSIDRGNQMIYPIKELKALEDFIWQNEKKFLKDFTGFDKASLTGIKFDSSDVSISYTYSERVGYDAIPVEDFMKWVEECKS